MPFEGNKKKELKLFLVISHSITRDNDKFRSLNDQKGNKVQTQTIHKPRRGFQENFNKIRHRHTHMQLCGTRSFLKAL